MCETRIQPTLNTVWAFIDVYIAQHGYAPSLRDIAAACQRSVTCVRYYLDRLEEQGRIARTPAIARSIRLIDPPSNMNTIVERIDTK